MLTDELIEAAALDIIKSIDKDLWKEVTHDDEEGLVDKIKGIIEDVISEIEENALNDDEDS